MQSFIYRVWSFLYDLYVNIRNTIPTTNNLRQDYDTFLSKQILDGQLLSVGMTWNELFLYGFVWAFIIFFIIMIIKLFLNMLGYFRLDK